MKQKLKLVLGFFILLIVAELGSYLYLVITEPVAEKRTLHWQAYENYLRLKREISPWSENRPHPFFGSINPSSSDLELRPWELSAENFRVGVIGGQVAAKLAEVLKASPSHPLLLDIRKRVPPARGKVMEVYSLTAEHMRQPQQMQVLNYFARSLDYLIQIDELSENLPDKRYPLHYPLDSHFLYPYDHDFWRSFVQTFHLGSLSVSMAEFARDKAVINKSNLYYLLWLQTKSKKKEPGFKNILQKNVLNEDNSGQYQRGLVYFMRRQLQLIGQQKLPYSWIVVSLNPQNDLQKNLNSKNILYFRQPKDIKINSISLF